jgi:hypothetical protein
VAADDAYGMSVVEAAAFGAPSLINGNCSIGASALLNGTVSPTSGMEGHAPEIAVAGPLQGCFEADFGTEDNAADAANAVAEVVLSLLDDPARLASVSELGRQRALGWSEEAAGRALYHTLGTLVAQA